MKREKIEAGGRVRKSLDSNSLVRVVSEDDNSIEWRMD